MTINEPVSDPAADAAAILQHWYNGSPEGRGLYALPDGHKERSSLDPFIGLMDSRDLAEEAAEAHNKCLSGDYT